MRKLGRYVRIRNLVQHKRSLCPTALILVCAYGAMTLCDSFALSGLFFIHISREIRLPAQADDLLLICPTHLFNSVQPRNRVPARNRRPTHESASSPLYLRHSRRGFCIEANPALCPQEAQQQQSQEKR